MSKKSVGIKGLLQKHVGGFEKARSKKEIHASDLTKDIEFCPREIVLMEKTGKKQKDQWIPFPLRLTFDEGNVRQGLLNNKYLKDFMYGGWICNGCGYTLQWSGYPTECCEGESWRYKEPFFFDPISEAQGSVDGFVKLPEEEHLRLMECKIASESVWVPLKAPLAEHKVRTQLYLALIARSGKSVV